MHITLRTELYPHWAAEDGIPPKSVQRSPEYPGTLVGEREGWKNVMVYIIYILFYIFIHITLVYSNEENGFYAWLWIKWLKGIFYNTTNYIIKNNLHGHILLFFIHFLFEKNTGDVKHNVSDIYICGH
jgi:hypothetical protein